MLAMLTITACKKPANQENKENSTKQEEMKKEENVQPNSNLTEFVSRSVNGVERIKFDFDITTNALKEIYFQGVNDAEFVKLENPVEKKEESKLIFKHPKTNEELVFGSDFTMAAVRYLGGDKTITLGPEVKLYSSDGQVLISGGGPTFFPFYLAKNETAEFVELTGGPAGVWR